ncbi:MAG TPA: hypothetical protein VNG33_24085, partial [Polyangiaceae bacterium]|nr:hypothetical protein [Polyangiaceae bacterium]
HHHVARTSGGAVALSYDERIAVATNREAGFVTIFELKPERPLDEMVTKTTVLDAGPDSEPWAAVIGADDDTAYVILRKAQQLIRIDHLRKGPVIATDSAKLGAEPMGLAISPTGSAIFVANWAEGTLSKVDTGPFPHSTLVDVNQRLVETLSLGDIKSRPGLAHPRAVTITDDGDQDEDDETLFVTEFFGQPIPGGINDISAVDSNHQGFVYSLAVGTGQPGPTIPISAVKATGFADSDGKMTSCFPNQLYAAAAEGTRLFVTAMCTSPAGPLDKQGDSTANFKTLLHPAVFSIDDSDPSMPTEVPEEGHLLTQVLQGLYDADAASAAPGPSAADVRMPLIPNDLALVRDSAGETSAFVLALGADTFFRLDYDATHHLAGIGSAGHRFVAPLPSKGYNIGLAVSRRSDRPFALALSDATQQLSVVDLQKDAAAKKVVAALPDTPRAAALREGVSPASRANFGRALFATGLGVWSFKGQAWSSCESCHPGGLSDGVTWYFSRGPRRTLSPANTYEKGSDAPAQRLLLWGANVDEVHDVEGIVRTVSGGTGAMMWTYPPGGQSSNGCRLVYDGKALPPDMPEFCTGGAKRTHNLLNGLNGSLASTLDAKSTQLCLPDDPLCDRSASPDWSDIDAFIRLLRLPKPPANLDPASVVAGRAQFISAGCASCHGNKQWTVSTRFYTPGDDANGVVPWPNESLALPAVGTLRQNVYWVPEKLAWLNPTAATSPRVDCPINTKCATFRQSPAVNTDAATLQLLYGDRSTDLSTAATAAAASASDDQIRCALRNVGTFLPLPGSSK